LPHDRHDDQSVPMQGTVVVEWEDYAENHERHEVDSVEQAIELVTRVERAGTAVLVDLYVIDGPSLTIGVGRSETVMCFQASQDPPYLATVGDLARNDLTDFSYGGQETEFQGRQLVSKQAIEPAIRQFFEARECASCVSWEEV
jgi:hypothetical protein